MTAKLKAVLFDMDDTLLDWSTRLVDWHEHERRHLHRLLDFVGRTVQPVNVEPERFFDSVHEYARAGWMEAERTLRAPSHAEALERALIDAGLPKERIDLDACLDAYFWEPMAGVTVFPDVPEVLSILRENGIAVGLVTNASVPMRLRDRELDVLGLLPYFSACRFAAVDAGYLKPHPAIFQTALNCLGVSPQEAVFVGDNLDADIVGAQNAGMRGILRRIAVRPLADFHGYRPPDGIVDTLWEMLPLLDLWYPGWRQRPPTETEALEDVSPTRTGQ